MLWRGRLYLGGTGRRRAVSNSLGDPGGWAGRSRAAGNQMWVERLRREIIGASRVAGWEGRNLGAQEPSRGRSEGDGER